MSLLYLEEIGGPDSVKTSSFSCYTESTEYIPCWPNFIIQTIDYRVRVGFSFIICWSVGSLSI